MSTATAKLLTIFTGGSINNTINLDHTNSVSDSNHNGSLVLRAPQQNEIKYFNETGILQLNRDSSLDQHSDNKIQKSNNKVKKKVTFPEDGKIIKDYSEPPKHGWTPGTFSTVDLLESYLKSCERHKCKPLNKLIPHLKALQDLDCANGEKVNVLNLKSERFDSKQMEALEEIFKRLSFKTIDLESSNFDDDSTGATLFEILQYYDTCERLILANTRSISLFGWQELSKFIRKSSTIEYLDLKGHTFPELIYFTYIARSFKLTQTLRVIHLEFSNIQGRYLIMLAAALKDNELVKEIYLSDNKLQSSDGNSISTLIKENNNLELIDLKNNNLQDIGLSYVCSGLSEKTNSNCGLKTLIISNNNITANGISYLSKALIHNRSLTTLNIGQNSLTNEAIYELKEALIVNKQISALYLIKTKLTDEGTIALAEYIAETQSLNRLDLRENDIRLGGLMALVSSLKFNKTLCRLDLDRDPKKENSIKDSIETSKRFIQDINEYCQRNKRIEIEREIAHKEQLVKQEEERQKLEIEEQIVEIDTDPTQIINDAQINETSNDLIEANKQEIVDLVDDDEKLLKKILNRSLNSAPSIHSPISMNDELINYLNIAKLKDENEFQLVESNIHKSESNDLINDIENYFDPKQIELLIDDNKEEVLATARQLVEDVVKYSQTNFAETNRETLNDSSLLDDSSLANFNDSNDLSQSIEKETLSDDQEINTEQNDLNLSICTLNGDNSTISTSINEEEDSDIEVLTVSTKTNVAILKLNPQEEIETTKGNERLKSAALLDSITEQEVNCLIKNQVNGFVFKETVLVEPDIESAAIMSNYDLLTDHLGQNGQNSFQIIESTLEKDCNDSSLNNYKLIPPDETTPPPTPTTLIQSLKASSSPFNNDDITSLETESNLLETDIKLSSTDHSTDLNKNQSEKITDINNKPFFASELTNSQMSEELSHEIGLSCE